MVRRLAWLFLALLPVSACNCGAGRVVGANGGAIRVTLIGVDPKAVTLGLSAISPNATVDKFAFIATIPLTSTVDQLMPATYVLRASAIDEQSMTLQSVDVPEVIVSMGGITELTIDLSRSGIQPMEQCDGVDNDGDGEIDEAIDLPACIVCTGGQLSVPGDDVRCGIIACSGLDSVVVRGDLSAAGEATCVSTRHNPITTARCAGPQSCKAPNGPACGAGTEVELAKKGLCQTMIACESGRPVIDRVANGTSCGVGRICSDGTCVFFDGGAAPVDAGVDAGIDAGIDAGTVDPSGCADGTREGFLALLQYPAIAGCSGAWSLPGITATTSAACNRAAGNTGTNREGLGCASADLCAVGWHPCRGKNEVGIKTNGSCADATPASAPASSLFFAVVQNSANDTTCDTSTSHNDVFGCGNLGILLTPQKNCGPLTRALASTQPGTCGFNEAEPSLGPWQCVGGVQSHLNEGAVVTKQGCPNTTCLSGGQPVGNSDKGGVLCCRD
ncbi:MAG: hypothetical protein Q8S33_16465 [Myxococcales bacterium]|nr:hypothetical protein [Myxococcales bacterium]